MIELGRVQRGQLDHRQLAAQRLVEALNRVLGAAVGALERNAAVGERQAHLDDRAPVARLHPLQRGHRPVDEAEIRHLGDAPELVGLDLVEGREHRDHRVVDPDVDRAELRLDAAGCVLELPCVAYVHLEHEPSPPGSLDLPFGTRERAPSPANATAERPTPEDAPVTTTI